MKLLLFLIFCCSISFGQKYGWKLGLELPGAGRDDAVCFTMDKIVFFGTGNHGGFNESNEFYGYNTRNQTWIDVPDFPGTQRQYATAEVVGFKAYLIGGSSPYNVALGDVWEFDLGEKKWSQVASFPGEARWAGASFVIDDNIYYGSGKDSVSSFNDFWKYNVTSDTWTRLADLPDKRFETVGFSVYDKGFIGLGMDSSGVLKSDIWEYDLGTNEWLAKTDFPGGPRYYAKAETLNGLAFIGTGEGPVGTFHHDFWSYDAATNEWVQVENVPLPARRGVSSCSIPYQGIYFLCGLDDNYERIIQIPKYTIRGFESTPLNVIYNSDNNELFVANIDEFKEVAVYNILGQRMFHSLDKIDHFRISTLNWERGTYVIYAGNQTAKLVIP